MNLLETLKQTATRFVTETPIIKELVPILIQAFHELEGTSAEVLGDETQFRAKVSNFIYPRLPQLVRQWVSEDRWHRFLHGVKDSVFLIEGRAVRLRPDFKASVNEFARRLLHGERAVTERPSVSQPADKPDTKQG